MPEVIVELRHDIKKKQLELNRLRKSWWQKRPGVHAGVAKMTRAAYQQHSEMVHEQHRGRGEDRQDQSNTTMARILAAMRGKGHPPAPTALRGEATSVTTG